jgi:hypothetical protein
MSGLFGREECPKELHSNSTGNKELRKRKPAFQKGL